MQSGAVKVLVVTPEGDVQEVDLPAGDTLGGKCQVIGCQRLDVVRLTTRVDMWIDEEGLYAEPLNQPATALAQAFGWVWQGYHGTVVIAEHDGAGNTTSLSAVARAAVLEILGG